MEAKSRRRLRCRLGEVLRGRGERRGSTSLWTPRHPVTPNRSYSTHDSPHRLLANSTLMRDVLIHIVALVQVVEPSLGENSSTRSRSFSVVTTERDDPIRRIDEVSTTLSKIEDG